MGPHGDPVNYATARLDAASGAMAALPGLPGWPLLLSPPLCQHRVPRGQADEPVARFHPVSCRFRPYAVVTWCSRGARARARTHAFRRFRCPRLRSAENATETHRAACARRRETGSARCDLIRTRQPQYARRTIGESFLRIARRIGASEFRSVLCG